MEAVVVRVRKKSSKSFQACSGVVMRDAGLVAVPLGLFVQPSEETGRFDPSCVHQHDGIQCSFERDPIRWLHASVQRVLPLWEYSPVSFEDILCPADRLAMADSLVIGHFGSTRESVRIASTLVLLHCERDSVETVSRIEQTDGTIGDQLSLPGGPFPQFLWCKFLHSKFNGAIAACLRADNTIQESVFAGGPCLYIVDAHAVPGLEGAPLILKDSGMVCGMLGYPITSVRVGAVFHLGWPIRFMYYAMEAMMKGHLAPMSVTACISPGPYDDAMALSVSIHTGEGSWASGFIIDAQRGIVVTNAHALAHDAVRVMVRSSHTGKQHKGSIMCSFAGIVDIAFVHVPDLHRYTSANASFGAEPVIGDSISVLGYPVWQNLYSQPIVTRGHVTSTLQDRKDIGVFTTDAKVISGASGALVVRDDDIPHVMGMVVSNTKIVYGSSSSTVYPSLNFCIPSIVINRAYKAVLSGKDSIKSISRAFIDQGLTHVWDTIHLDATLSKL